LDVIKGFQLYQNYPNPFNPAITIKFNLPKTSYVTLKIYNILGQEIRTILYEHREAGYHSVKWDGTNNYGLKVSSGIYIYRITTDKGYTKARKMVSLK